MIPRFALERPRTLPDAFEAFHAAGGDAAYIAGGTELLQVMKMGLAQFSTLVDLKQLPELHGIQIRADGTLVIGAATTHRQIERSLVIHECAPAFVSLARDIANVRVRATGTLGGNLAFAEPHSDPSTFLLACDGQVELRSASGSRFLGMDEFIVGPLATAREPHEILTSVRIPAPEPGVGMGYAKIAFFERPAVSVAVRVVVRERVIRSARIAIGSLTDLPTAVDEASNRLIGGSADEALTLSPGGPVDAAVDALSTLDAVSDLNGSADYKRHLAGVLLRRTIGRAIAAVAAHG